MALSMLMEASSWLSSRGISQWPMEWIVSPVMRSWLTECANRGELYLAGEEGARMGVFTLVNRQEGTDSFCWGQDSGECAYLHSFAVRRAWAGRGLGRRMLSWAEEASVSAGKKLLRLDCSKDNPRLRRWYEEAGYALRGECLPNNTGGRVLALYEKDLAKRP